MADVQNEAPNGAAALLGIWMNANLKWSELLALPDTKRAEAMKDPEPYRGSRICAAGSVIEIHTDRSVSPPLFHGGLMTSSLDMVRFIAGRSTTNITEGGTGRFCGIIIRTQSYLNASEGTTHPLFVVGAFDTPANRKDN